METKSQWMRCSDRHFRVNHGNNAFSRGKHHIDGIEFFWRFAGEARAMILMREQELYRVQVLVQVASGLVHQLRGLQCRENPLPTHPKSGHFHLAQRDIPTLGRHASFRLLTFKTVAQ